MRQLWKMLVLVLVLTMAAWPLSSPAANGKADVAAEAKAAREDIKAVLGFVPGFLKIVPDNALPGAWDEMKALWLSPSTALPAKTKELIGLAVSAQIPCKACIYAHTEFARLSGASDAEIAEAVLIGAITRHWSTFMNGLQLDEGRFRAELGQIMVYGKKIVTGKLPPPPALKVVDHDSAVADIKANFGLLPEFLAKVPAAALSGAWKELKYVEMAGDTAIPLRHKSLIGLAVASQIPCKFCIIADTEFARLDGASDAEIGEAVAMAAMVRHWSTWLNGMQINESTFKKDIALLIRNAKKDQKSASVK